MTNGRVDLIIGRAEAALHLDGEAATGFGVAEVRSQRVSGSAGSGDSSGPALCRRPQFGVRPRIGFAPVGIAPEATPAGVADRGTIEIEFAMDARMRITGAVDTTSVTATVAVLTDGRRR
jgi:hypothetical protein